MHRDAEWLKVGGPAFLTPAPLGPPEHAVEVSHFIYALSVSFFALLGIWAAVVRRHWFLRFAAVGGFLLITLLLPAYELVIEFGLQMAIIATGVWLARGRQRCGRGYHWKRRCCSRSSWR